MACHCWIQFPCDVEGTTIKGFLQGVEASWNGKVTLCFRQAIFIRLGVGSDAQRTDTPRNKSALVETEASESDPMLSQIRARLPAFDEHGKNVSVFKVVRSLRKAAIITMHFRNDLETVAKMRIKQMLLRGFQGVVLKATTETPHLIKGTILFLDRGTELFFKFCAVLSACEGHRGKQQRENAFHG